MKDSHSSTPNIKIWDAANDNIDDLELAICGKTAGDLASGPGEIFAVKKALQGFLFSQSTTAHELLRKVGDNDRHEDIIIVPMGNVDGGFIHKEVVRNRGNYIHWSSKRTFTVSYPNHISRGYDWAKPTTEPKENKINLPGRFSYSLIYSAELQLFHELGHAYQYIYANDKYMNAYTNDVILLDAMNIGYVERTILKESGRASSVFFALREKYGNSGLKGKAKGETPNLWRYDDLIDVTTINKNTVYEKDNTSVYDPLNLGEVMGNGKQTRFRTNPPQRYSSTGIPTGDDKMDRLKKIFDQN
jgi:hypothetical protein